MGLFGKLLKKTEETGKQEKGLLEKNTAYAPVEGELIPLEEFPDEVFRSGLLGPGCGIIPAEGLVWAPFHGTVEALPDSRHAVGLRSEDGMELLIHVGVDTVEMNGKGFEAYVQVGDTVEKGERLLSFSLDEIEKAGYNNTVAVIVSNSSDYKSVEVIAKGQVNNQMPIIKAE